ncbi:MAG TPA: permease [Acidobacteriaceae bacterium]
MRPPGQDAVAVTYGSRTIPALPVICPIRGRKAVIYLCMGWSFLDLRRKSLLRGSVLVLGSLALAFSISHFPENRRTLLLILPAMVAFAGAFETLRCVQPRWSLYHAGVMFSLYMDVMAIAMILFLLLYPYMPWVTPH